MIAFVRDVFVVAQYELSRALRTRLVQVVILGYAVAMLVGDWSFVKALSIAETQVAAQLGLPGTERPGTLLAHVTESEVVRRMLADAVGSDSVVAHLISFPLLSVWSGVVAMVALPVVMLSGTAGSLAGEVQSRSVRFLVLRTERLSIVFGKLLGQWFIAAAATLVGIAVTVGVGEFLMVEQNPFEIAAAAALFTLRGLVYSIPFGAFGLFVSQWVPSRNGARVLAIVAWLGCVIYGGWLDDAPMGGTFGEVCDIVRWFLPTTGWDSLWATDWDTLGVAIARVDIVTLVWIALGYLRFSTRDL